MRFHPLATEDLLAAAQWYEMKAPGFGGLFLDAVEAGVSVLVEHPKIGGVWRNQVLPEGVDVRRFPLRMFPFLIIYVLEPEPTIIAIAHGSRRPGYWAGRMD